MASKSARKVALTLKSLVARPVAVPMRRPLQTSSGAITTAPLILVDLMTNEGVVGRSYLFAISRAHLKPMLALLAEMGAMLQGDPVLPYEMERKLRAKHTLLGVHNVVLFAMSAIDMCAWDALGQALGLPVARLLGGAPKPIAAYNSNGLGIQPLKPLVKEAVALVGEGFNAVKLRLGRPSAAADIEALRAVKKAIGPGITLMVDFNQGLTVAEAIRRGRMIDDEGGVLWIEEPIRADDFAGCAKVAREVATPIQIGENFMGPEQAAQAIAAGSADYVMPDAQRIGGVTGWMRAAALAQGAGLEMSSHLFPEASVQLLAVTPTCHWLEYVDWANPVLREPVRIDKGYAHGPARAGLGMAWDEKAVKKFAA